MYIRYSRGINEQSNIMIYGRIIKNLSLLLLHDLYNSFRCSFFFLLFVTRPMHSVQYIVKKKPQWFLINHPFNYICNHFRIRTGMDWIQQGILRLLVLRNRFSVKSVDNYRSFWLSLLFTYLQRHFFSNNQSIQLIIRICKF